jgi:hypothetical protein
LASCLRVNLTMQDLRMLTYVDVMKILVSSIDKNEERHTEKTAKIATQVDIDRLLA